MESYKKVPYDLRPKKQIERKMIIETFFHLTRAGFPIKDYEYIGFGSTFFVDFILFHRILGIGKMTSIEKDDRITNRVLFNRPFKFIDIHMGEFSDVVPRLNEKSNYIVWLDYDCPVYDLLIQDISNAVANLPIGSLFFVTIDVEPPQKDSKPKEWLEYYQSNAKGLFDKSEFNLPLTKEMLVSVNVQIIKNAIFSAVSRRSTGRFQPLFNFFYADGHNMITMGGMLVSEKETNKINEANLKSLEFVRQSFDVEPYKILLPILTRKERSFLDSHMPSIAGWSPTEFEITPDEVNQYQKVYRFCPLYVEILF